MGTYEDALAEWGRHADKALAAKDAELAAALAALAECERVDEPPQPPPPPPPTVDFLELPGPLTSYPDATNTGVPADGRTLTVIDGNYTTTGNGQDLYNFEIRGRLTVNHANVTVRYCNIAGEVSSNSTGLRLWHTTIAVPDTSTRGQCVGKNNYTARRCDLSGAFDGFRVGSNVDIQDCYVHDLLTAMDDWYDPPQQSHNDGVKCDGGSGNRVVHNRFDCWPVLVAQNPGDNWGRALLGAGFEEQYQNAAIMLAAKSAPMDNWLIEDNVFQGPVFKYINFGFANSTKPISRIVIRNNRYTDMMRDTFTNGSGKTGITVTGNTALASIIPRNVTP